MEMATLSDFLVDDYESYVSWGMALKNAYSPKLYYKLSPGVGEWEIIQKAIFRKYFFGIH